MENAKKIAIRLAGSNYKWYQAELDEEDIAAGYTELWELCDMGGEGQIIEVAHSRQEVDESPYPVGSPESERSRRRSPLTALVSVGDKITNPGGVNATDIPVGATVRYSTGVDQKTGDYEVILSKGKKMLGSGGTPLWVGQDGPMTVLSLPGTAIPEPHDGPDYSVSKAEPGV